MTTNKKLAYLLSTGAFLGSAVLFPASAAQITISGNGAFSDNDVRVSERNDFFLRQSNNTSINNDVRVSNNTGNNSASFNTGGDVTIRTGDATSNVSINNAAGLNVANVSGWDGHDNDTYVRISGNGAFSDNSVRLSESNRKVVTQNNNTHIDNDVDVHNNTGNNRADFNTGWYDNGHYWYKKDNNNDHKYFDKKDYDHDKKSYDNKDYGYDHKKVDYKNYGHGHDYDKDHYSYKKHDAHDKNYRDNDHHKYVVYFDHNKKYDNQHDWYKNCHYYLNFWFEHKGYGGNHDCKDAYAFYHEHKYDHFGYDKVSYHNDSYNYHDDDKKYGKHDWDKKYSNHNYNKHEYDKKYVYFYPSYGHDKFDHKKYFLSSYAKKYHDKYDWYKDWKKHYNAKKVAYHKNGYSDKKNDCHYFTQKFYSPKYSKHHGNSHGNVTIHTGDAHSNVHVANAAGFNYASYK